jgi:hypothetical protein
MTTRVYGVSSGNGNHGVSHTFADYYVRTTDPWRLAHAAIIAEFKSGTGQAWAMEHCEIDGEADYTISAVILDPPNDESEDSEYPTLYVCDECGFDSEESSLDGAECTECESGHFAEKEFDDYEDGRNWSESNGAWLIVEVFPEDSPRDGVQIYDSIEDALSEDVLRLVPAE